MISLNNGARWTNADALDQREVKRVLADIASAAANDPKLRETLEDLHMQGFKSEMEFLAAFDAAHPGWMLP